MGYKDNIVDQYPYLTYANEPGATAEDAGGDDTVTILISYAVAPVNAPTATIFDKNGEVPDVPIELTLNDATSYIGNFPIGALFTINSGASGLALDGVTYRSIDPDIGLPFSYDKKSGMIISIVLMYDAAIRINNGLE